MTDRLISIFGANLFLRRKELGINRKDLAKLVHVSVNTIQSYEAGKLPRGKHLYDLALALECSIDWLVGLDEKRSYQFFVDKNQSSATSGQSDRFKSLGCSRDFCSDLFDISKFISLTTADCALNIVLKYMRDYLSEISTNLEKIRLMQVQSAAMSPIIQKGDIALIDQGKVSVEPGEIYAVRITEQDQLSLKRLATKPGDILTISCDNPMAAPPYDVGFGEAEVIGKMIWHGRSLI